ncbi:MAG: ribosome silencing factor [Gammaproteobacteria bacterium]
MNAAEIIRVALEEGKGVDIKIIAATRQSGGLFSYMIIATANSPRHAAALASRVRRALKIAGGAPKRAESSAEKSWILVDAGDAVAHIMLREARARYDLENLWCFEEDPQ